MAHENVNQLKEDLRAQREEHLFSLEELRKVLQDSHEEQLELLAAQHAEELVKKEREAAEKSNRKADDDKRRKEEEEATAMLTRKISELENQVSIQQRKEFLLA